MLAVRHFAKAAGASSTVFAMIRSVEKLVNVSAGIQAIDVKFLRTSVMRKFASETLSACKVLVKTKSFFTPFYH